MRLHHTAMERRCRYLLEEAVKKSAIFYPSPAFLRRKCRAKMRRRVFPFFPPFSSFLRKSAKVAEVREKKGKRRKLHLFGFFPPPPTLGNYLSLSFSRQLSLPMLGIPGLPKLYVY